MQGQGYDVPRREEKENAWKDDSPTESLARLSALLYMVYKPHAKDLCRNSR